MYLCWNVVHAYHRLAGWEHGSALGTESVTTIKLGRTFTTPLWPCEGEADGQKTDASLHGAGGVSGCYA